MGKWRDIETAPKDGTRVLMYIPPKFVRNKKRTIRMPERFYAAAWFEDRHDTPEHPLSAHARELVEKHGGFWSYQGMGRRPTSGSPTHWMPLPNPPEATDD